MHPLGSAGQHCEFTAASYFSWPTSSRLSNAAEERANYFSNLQKEEDEEEDEVSPEPVSTEPKGQRATTLLELMTIRAFHSKILRCYSLGTAIGFRIRRGVLTDIPAIIVFVSRKVHKQWLSPLQCLPTALEVYLIPKFDIIGMEVVIGELCGLGIALGSRRDMVRCGCGGVFVFWGT